MSTTVAIYCRLSEEDKDKVTGDSGSIENQKNMLQDYAKAHHWEIFRIYSDDDYAGADRNRPAFLQLLTDAEARQFHIVLCKTQSRFTRELELVEKYIHGLFPLWGIRFLSIVDNADTENKGNKKSRQINGLINQWYLEDLSENIRSVLQHRQQQGLHIGSFALYGYVKDPNRKGHLLPDPYAAKVVKEVFTLFSQGMGKTAIARHLNSCGIPNPTEYKRLQGLRYRSATGNSSTQWKYPAISSMLRNEMYLGHMVQGRYGSISYKTKENHPRPKEQWVKVEHTHQALISQELWDKVVSMLESKAKPFTTGHMGLFSGKAKCLYCGYGMRSSKNRGRRYLQCSSRHVAKDGCMGSFIPVTELETLVLQEWERLCSLHLNQKEILKSMSSELPLQINSGFDQEEEATLIQRIQNNKKYLEQMYLDKLQGLISQEQYLELLGKFQKEIALWEQALKACSVVPETQALEEIPSPQERNNQLIDSIVKPYPLTRELVELLIDCIYIGKRNPTTKEIPVEIHWTL